MARVLLLCVVATASMAEPLIVKGPKKTQIVFPLGAVSFADEVVTTKPGAKLDEKKEFGAERALGVPDKQAVTLGCAGSVTFRFVDNAVVDLPGGDLYVFEDGPNVEPTRLELSVDGVKWVDVGRIEGGTREVDLAGKVPDDEVFHFVRLTDLDDPKCGGRFPGADVDAVGAMGSALQVQLSTEVLFDTGKSELKGEGQDALHEVVGKVKAAGKAKLRVLGHTDSQGSGAFNSKLSEARAQAVVTYLRTLEGLKDVAVDGKGYGESRPVAPNETVEGRQKNRRVDVLVIPLP